MKAIVAAPQDRQLTETISDYLAQISLSLRPSSVLSARGNLGRFDGFLADEHSEVAGAADLGRAHIESYKAWLVARGGRKGRPTPNTIRANLGTVRMFLERIIEWGWDDAPLRLVVTGRTRRLCRRTPSLKPTSTGRRHSGSFSRALTCPASGRALAGRPTTRVLTSRLP